MKPGKILHIAIAIALMVSTIGVVINKHYSGGELFSTALFIGAESCCVSNCCHQQPVSDCSEESDYFRLATNYIIPINTKSTYVQSVDVLDFETFNSISYNLSNNTEAAILALCIFKPPPKTIDIPVLFHSLLI